MKNYLKYLVASILCIGATFHTFGQGCTVEAFASSVDIVCGDTVRLGAAGSGVLAFRNNFNCGQVQCPEGDPNDSTANYGTWANSSTAQFDNPCLPDHPGNGPHIWFNQNTPSPRALETTGLPIANGAFISWDMRFADPDLNGNASPCENPDAGDEGVALQYSVDNGLTWNNLAYYGPGNGNDPDRTIWKRYPFSTPANLTPALTNNTRIRWVQLGNTGTPGNYLDHWGMDNAQIIANPPNVTYTWQHTGIARNTGATDPVVPLNTTTYTVTYDDGTNTCTDNVTVNVRRQTVQVEQVPPGPLCPGETVTLVSEAEIGIPNYSCGKTTECQGSTRHVQLGMGTVTDNTYQALGAGTGGGVSVCSNGSGNYTNSAKTQFIIEASEFPSFINGGQIYQIELNSATNGSWPNFQVSMGCTNKSSYTSSANAQWVTGLDVVYTPKNTSLVDGWNILVLDENFEWDGKSNLVVQICWRGATSRGQLRKTNTPGRNSVIHASGCSDVGCGSYGAVKEFDDNRPSFQVDMCYRVDPKLTYTWTPSTGLGTPNEQNTTASPTASTTYTLTVGGENLPSQCDVQQTIDVNVISLGAFNPSFEEPWCAGTDLKLFAEVPGAANYSWTGPNGFTSSDENPVITAADASYEGTYTLTVSTAGCSGTSTVDVTVTPEPNPGTPVDTTICTFDGPFNLEDAFVGADPNGTFIDDDNSGALTENIFDVELLDRSTLPATFQFTYEVTGDCGTRSATVNITVNPYWKAGDDNFGNICESLGTVDLNDYRTGDFDENGRWEDPDNTGQLSGSILTTTNLGYGEYNFWYIQESILPCVNDTAVINLIIENQPYAGEDATGSVCVDNTVNLFQLLGNNPDGNGTWTELTASGGVITGNEFDATAVPAGTYRFKYEITAVDPCIASESFIDLDVHDNPVITDVQVNCAGDNENYIVTFKVVGGDPSTYAANIGGSFDGNGNFTSDLIPSETPTTITITDANGCGGATIDVNKKCDCTTATSDMRTDTTVVACEGQTAQGIDLGGYFSDGNDTLAYYLHEGNGPSLSGIWASNHTGEFGFQAGMTYGKTYYISSGAGDNDGSNFPLQSDGCFIVSQGTPVIFYRNPVTTLTVSPNPICPGDQATLTATTVNAAAPFDIIINGGSAAPYSGVGRSATQTVSEISNTTYTVANVVDKNGCVGTGNSVNLDVNVAPTATIKAGSGCGVSGSLLDIDVTGSGTQWTIYVSNDFNAVQDVYTCDANGFTGAPSFEDNESPITYTIDSVVDNSGSICPGVGLGSYTVNPPVSGVILGTDSAYCPGNPIQLIVSLTGIGPWDINFRNGLGGNVDVTANKRVDTLLIPNPYPAGNYSFTINRIDDQATGCSGSGSGSASVTVNDGPNAQVGFNLVDPLDLNPSKQETICVDETINIDFQYLSGSGDLTVNWLIDGFTQTPVTVSQGSKTSVLYNPQGNTGTYEIRILSVTDNTSAGCTGGGDIANITVKSLPTVVPNIPTEVCEGDMVNFTYFASGEGNVDFDIVDQNDNVLGSFSNPAGSGITESFPAPAPGNYTLRIVSITDGGVHSCSGTNTSSFPLQVSSTPKLTLTQGVEEICEGSNASIPYTVSGNGPFDLVFNVSNGGAYDVDIPRNDINGNGTLSIPGLAAGTYTVTGKSIAESGGAGCVGSGTGSTQIVVNPAPKVKSMSFSQNPICEGENTTILFEIEGNGPFTVSYTDGLNGSFSANVPDDGLFESQPFAGVATSEWRITDIKDGSNPQCPPIGLPAKLELTVNENPEVRFTVGDKICADENAATVGYIISGGSGPFNVNYKDHNQKPYSVNLNGGSGTFSFSQLSANDSLRLTPTGVVNTVTGCVGTVINNPVDVVSKPLPAANIQYLPALVGCAPFTPVAYFDEDMSYDAKTASFQWNLNGNVQNNIDSVYPVLDQPNSSLGLGLEVTTIHGCTNSGEVVFRSFDDPIADFEYGPGEPTTMQSEITFRSTSSMDATKFNWIFNGSVVGAKGRLKYDFPAEPGLHEICLAVKNNGGCADTLCKMIEVTGVLQVFIPSTFTPDGDGINDVFRPIVDQPMEGKYEFKIYNRWGELMFETKNPDEGWNGRTISGNELVPPGVFVYHISLTSAYNEKVVFKEHGTVTVTR
ncbi:T9SS type B sorting domain-containing protein [Luteibaculum oceani]|uniref:T9SS type B sorting domain-containing protein n=1 Tax=Luteibaculum oceani TaxID=1294296 RepID=A0A5C6VBC0_9FLAO|nr:gliding motility-associated C-terminal domain-containing protein [Luteibaculum oceani]TXC81686.1 T9SS type B sorting domain-containing protein [Luteibaculum oceani]